MNFKKMLALLLAVVMLTVVFAACGQKTEDPGTVVDPGTEDPGTVVDPGTVEIPDSSAPEWAAYDALIAEIKTTTDYAKRVELMHQAEDMLMDTGALLPIYYYTDMYMAREGLEGFYANAFGTKFFMYATYGDNSVLKVNLASEPDHLDPALNSSVDGACLAANSMGGLYTYDAEGNLIPNFATGYEMSEDGLTYVFTMREGLVWSDGTPLTAKDFEYSWKRAANPATAADYCYMLNGIVGYEEAKAGDANALQVTASEDGTTLTVVMAAPCAYMLDLMAFPTFYAVKQDQVEAAAEWETNPGAWAGEAGFVSAGAYVLESWVHDESMVYVKNPLFWDAENVKIERLEFMLSADDTAIYAAYNAGDIDFADTIPTDAVATLIAENNPEFHIIENLGTYYVCFNVYSPLFEGKTVEQAANMRKAFALLVDRDYIVETITMTGEVPATGFIPAGMMDGNGGIFKDANAWNYPVGDGYYEPEVNVEAAIALLESAGYKFVDGKLDPSTPISFEYLTNESSRHIAIAECLQQDFAEIGITMTIRQIDWNTFLDERKAGNYDIARNGWLADFNDPINMLEMWTTESGNNDVQFGKPPVDPVG